MPTRVRHIIQAQQFSRSWLETQLFPEADRMATALKNNHTIGQLAGKSVCLLFYEPSTRTRISFEQAAAKLGMTFSSTENARDFSSAVKGESLPDTIRVANALQFDAIILRHNTEGSAKIAAKVSKIPIINAGDGGGQHPTQALLDVYTMKQHFSTLDNLTVAFVGDLKNGRTVRSAVYLLSKYRNIHFDFVAPHDFQMRPDILAYLTKHAISYALTDNLLKVSKRANILYLTRIQTERMAINIDKEVTGAQGVKLTDEVLANLHKNSIIMHPLPRVEAFGELKEKYTTDKRVVIFNQVLNGLYIRMALLKMLLS